MSRRETPVLCAHCMADFVVPVGRWWRRKLPDACPACGAQLTGRIDALGRALVVEGTGRTPWEREPTADDTREMVKLTLTDAGGDFDGVVAVVRQITVADAAEAERLVTAVPAPLCVFTVADAVRGAEQIHLAGGKFAFGVAL